MQRILAFIALAHGGAASSFSFSSLFASGMTLQAGEPAARVWGWADGSATVTVYQRHFNTSGGAWGSPSLAVTATASPNDGLWIAQLPPTLAGGPYRLEFYAKTAAGASITNATLDWLWFGVRPRNACAAPVVKQAHRARPHPIPTGRLLVLGAVEHGHPGLCHSRSQQ